MKYRLSEIQQKEITTILASYDEVEEAILFGSRVMETFKEASDVDIAIKGKKANGSLAMTLKGHFEEETYLPFFFDVVAYDRIQSDELKQHIDSTGKVLYRRRMGDLSASHTPAGWREVILEDITTRIGDGLHGTPKYDSNGNYYFVNGNNLKNGKILIKPDIKKVTEEEALKHEKPLSERTILLSINGTIGNLACYTSEKCMLGKSACYINITEDVSVPYMYYHFMNEEFQFYIEMVATGTTIPNVPLKGIRQYSFNLPPFPEQKAIAEVLSSLDDKIDLLHRQNKTLEQMAETLFRQWFVIEAQEDWQEYKVSDIANHVKENIKPALSPLQVYKHYSLPAFDNGQNPIIEVGKEILSNKYRVIPKSILVSKLNPRFPRIWEIPSDVREHSICSTEFQVIKPKSESYYGFLCFLFKSDDAVGELEMAASGTSGSHQRVKPQDILNISFITSSFHKIEDYSQQVIPLIKNQQKNKIQIRTLVSLRDTLLPKLMSGEVRVDLSAGET